MFYFYEAVALLLFSVALSVKIFFKRHIKNCNFKKDLSGKVAIVTGGNSGIGYEIALQLAKWGCKVIIADISDAKQTVEKIQKYTNNETVFCKYLDLGSLKSVRKFAEEIRHEEQQLDILINNGGCCGFPNIYTSDGLYKIMQINYLSHFLLTHLLLDLLKKTQRSRVIFQCSIIASTHCITNADQINHPTKCMLEFKQIFYDYSNTKFCLLLASTEFARKLKDFGVIVLATHPGMIKTSINKSGRLNNVSKLSMLALYVADLIYYTLGQSIKSGAKNTLYCATADNVISGGYYNNSSGSASFVTFQNTKLCKDIWSLSEGLVRLESKERL